MISCRLVVVFFSIAMPVLWNLTCSPLRRHSVHFFLHITTTMSQTCQRNGILRRCAKRPRNVQNAACAAETNTTSVSRKRTYNDLAQLFDMKSMWPPLVAIFFMTYFYRAGNMAPSPPPPPDPLLQSLRPSVLLSQTMAEGISLRAVSLTQQNKRPQ